MKKPNLVIMAAGMGSRYGGLKQIDSVDSYGHTIIDYSIYDAMKAGFDEITFVIKKAIEEDFFAVMKPHLENKAVKVNFVYQEIDKLPEGFKAPKERTKPWGTAHAVLCCKDVIDGPFAVINADDYYGPKAYKLIYDFLSKLDEKDSGKYAMIGYRIKNTVSSSGTVSRGICQADEEGNLTEIIERTKIGLEGEEIYFYEEDQKEKLSGDALVSMNFWGFDKNFISMCETHFVEFLEKTLENDPLKGEFYLPKVVASLIDESLVNVKVIETEDTWHGVTHKEDHPEIVRAFEKMQSEGLYPKTF